MDKKIYIVTSGEYSDYSIDAVFSTKEKAKEYIQQYGTDYAIEEYDLDQEVKKETKIWKIMFDKNGVAEALPSFLMKEADICFVSVLWDGERYIHIHVDADSMDRAIKIARERYAAIRANSYIWLRLTRPYATDGFGGSKFEKFNIKTNEFFK